MMEGVLIQPSDGVLIQPSDGAWIDFQPAVRYVDPKLGWVNVFLGGPVGRVVARNFPILQIHPQFGYSTILGVFPQSCIRWRLRFHSCSTILPVQRMQRMSRDSPEATSHVSCSPMKPCPQFARVASIDFHTLQPSE